MKTSNILQIKDLHTVKVLQTLYQVKNDETPPPVRSYLTWQPDGSRRAGLMKLPAEHSSMADKLTPKQIHGTSTSKSKKTSKT